jgi:hypothetical protein
MPVTTARLLDIFTRPAPSEPDIPAWLAEPLGRHDLRRCGCDDGEPCTAGLWSEGAITTEMAAERLGAPMA